MATQNISLDGLNNFNAFGTNGSWSNQRINYVSVGIDPGEDPNEANSLNVSLAGGEWRIRHLNFYNDVAFDYDVNLTDANDGVLRRIERLQVSGTGDTAITLFNTRVQYLEVFDNRTLALTLGAQNLNYLQSDGRLNTISIGTGSVTSMTLGGAQRASTNTINGGSGFINALSFNEGSTNVINNGGAFGSIRSNGISNTFTLGGGGDALSLGSGISRVNLTDGFYGSITSYSGTNTITIGATAEVRSIGFSGGVDIVTVNGRLEQAQLGGANDRLAVNAGGQADVVNLGDGDNFFRTSGNHVWVVNAFSGNDTFQFTAGQTDQANAGGGNNVITVSSGYFLGTLRANDGNDRLTVNGGDIGSVMLGGGNNTVTMNGGQINSFQANGNETISLLGDARILQLKMDEGVNRLTTQAGNIESIYAYNAQNTITLGEGGAQQIVLNGSAAAQVIQSTGWLGSLQVYAGNLANVQSTTVVTGTGGAGYIQTSKGNDRITTGAGLVDNINTYDGNDTITIGAGGVRALSSGIGNDILNLTNGSADWLDAGAGNDTVTLGVLGARVVVLGAGDDTISMAATQPAVSLLVQGDGGSDTAYLGRFASGVTVSLNLAGVAQNFGVVGSGSIALVGIENLTGTASADQLEGNASANRLVGGSGQDTLLGLAGNDQLIGGAAADVLTGGDGSDRFVFVPTDGSDRITDFVVGQDQIELRAANALADITFTQVGTDVRLSFGTLRILVEDQTVAAMQDLGNFLF